MHGSFDKSGKSESSSQPWRIGFFAFPVILAVALIALVILEPAASKWISDAAQAEFASIYGMPESTPSQFAQPATMEVRTVSAY